MTDWPSNDQVNDLANSTRRTVITTVARLHFGLFDTSAPFGGIGVMIDRPATSVEVTPAATFRCESDSLPRIESVIQRISQVAGLKSLPPCRLQINQQAESHCGLGSGTQLALATAEAICLSIDWPTSSQQLAVDLADRGKRSAVGIHGYFQGGLILESNRDGEELNPIELRTKVSSQWRVAIFRPADAIDPISGHLEREQFRHLPSAQQSVRDALHDSAMQIVAAANQRDFVLFSASVARYNRDSGRLFESVQGGPYNGPEITSLVDDLVRRGAVGVGQSSWGPGVFAWFESEQDAETFVDRLPPNIRTIAIAPARNKGRQIERSAL